MTPEIKAFLETKARMGDSEARKLLGHCVKCNDTGKLTGAQNFNESFLKKNGTPYYTADCGCKRAR